MMKLKNNKGVTLVALTITIIVLLIITSITISNSKSQLAMRNVNQLYSDIESISTKVSDYYLKNNSLPVFESHPYLNSKNQLNLLVIANGGESSEIINPNDDGNYYVINLSKLENLTLNYGREYKNWNDSSNFQDYQDLYIINEVTHQVYYPKGIKYNGTVYFSRDVDTNTVNKIESSNIADDGIQVTINNSNLTMINNETTVIVDANITLNISPDLKKDTLEYGWKRVGDTSEVIYTKFSLDESNSALVSSKKLVDNVDFYLYIKIMDINGNEHIKEYTIRPVSEKTNPYLPSDDFIELAGTNLSTGLVTQDNTGNEYVWIEVPRKAEVYPTAGISITDFRSEEYEKIENDLHEYTNTYRNGTSYTDTYFTDSTTGWFADETAYNAAKQKMLKSVYQNGGFWIGRYEAGIETNRTASGEATVVPQSKANLYPYTYVTRTQAKVLAEQVNSGSYTSSLMFGVQWDLVLKYLETKGATESELKTDSTSWGNYNNNKYKITNTNAKYSLDYGANWINAPYEKTENKDVLLTTGANTIFSKQNIYDLAGNVWGWTNEYTSDASYPCSRRGGSYGSIGSVSYASYRGYDVTSVSDYYIGFRLSLY